MRKIFFKILAAYRQFKKFTRRVSGKTEDDIHLQRLATGKSWNEFCDSLKAAGAALVHGNAPLDAQSQAEGYRYLARLTRTALDAFVEHNDAQFPQLLRMVHETAKIGADNPDNYYQNAQIDADFEYCISGSRNSIDYLSLHVFNGSYGSAEGVTICSELEDEQIQKDSNGNFEIFLSKEARGNNWMKIDNESTLLIVRQRFLDRQVEVPADLKIECLNGMKTPMPLSPTSVDKALGTASVFVSGVAMQFSNWANKFSKRPNELPLMDEKLQKGAGGDDNLIYYHGYFNLKDDECLVINTRIPDCSYWNFQVNNYWMESLDYRYHKIHLNNHSAKLNEDGTVTVIVSKTKVDHPNWLTTAGHNEGTMLWRWFKPDEKITPLCEVRKVSGEK